MVQYFVDFANLSAANSGDKASSAASKKETYCQTYTNADVKSDLLAFFQLPDHTSLSKFCQIHSLIPKTTFHRHFKDSGLVDIKSQGKPLEYARAAVEIYVNSLKESKLARTKQACELNKYLTKHQELSIVQLVRVLGAMGGGVSKNNTLKIIDKAVNLNLDEGSRHECSEKVLERLLEEYQDLVKVLAAGSIDPQRAKKASEECRDAMFI
jgi:hypothetical protein